MADIKELENAIKALNNLNLVLSISDSERKAVNIALEILQEKLEHEKGCKHCTGVVLNIAEEETVFELGYNYCPICGRSLKEDTK